MSLMQEKFLTFPFKRVSPVSLENGPSNKELCIPKGRMAATMLLQKKYGAFC